MKKDDLILLGYASGIAGKYTGTGNTPFIIQQSPYLKNIIKDHERLIWHEIISHKASMINDQQAIASMCSHLANQVTQLIKGKKRICVLGGDHTCAIGTWSGAQNAIHEQGELGLIWLDAHMDSHTPETTESGRIHGMPLACLLGYGYDDFTRILNASAKINPKNVCLIGVRSFEKGEADLLQRLNVRVFLMEEVQKKGLATVMQEAVAHVSQHSIAYGLSIDIDSLDPIDAPGVDVPEPNGIQAKELFEQLASLSKDPKLIAIEIAEFDADKDIDHKTEKLVINLLKIYLSNI